MLNKKLYSKSNIKKYALNYLNKFGTSQNYLTNFLVKKIKNRFHITSLETLTKDVEEVVIELKNSGYINDIMFCESRLRALIKEGNSLFSIIIKLRQKSISNETIENALNNIINTPLNGSKSELEEYALLKYTKKRNFLLWQQTSNIELDSSKTINTLLRKGFDLDSVKDLINLNNNLNICQNSFEEYLINLENKYNL